MTLNAIKNDDWTDSNVRIDDECWTWVEMYSGYGSGPIPVCKLCGAMVPYEMKATHEAREPG